MRKLLATLLAVSVGFVGGVVWLGSSLRAGAGGVVSASGDVKGDGQIDVSDAGYRLLHCSHPSAASCSFSWSSARQ